MLLDCVAAIDPALPAIWDGLDRYDASPGPRCTLLRAALSASHALPAPRMMVGGWDGPSAAASETGSYALWRRSYAKGLFTTGQLSLWATYLLGPDGLQVGMA